MFACFWQDLRLRLRAARSRDNASAHQKRRQSVAMGMCCTCITLIAFFMCHMRHVFADNVSLSLAEWMC